MIYALILYYVFKVSHATANHANQLVERIHFFSLFRNKRGTIGVFAYVSPASWINRSVVAIFFMTSLERCTNGVTTTGTVKPEKCNKIVLNINKLAITFTKTLLNVLHYLFLV